MTKLIYIRVIYHLKVNKTFKEIPNKIWNQMSDLCKNLIQYL